ncbi:conserved hypothetical protein [Gammaproteobacteria bacterium]
MADTHCGSVVGLCSRNTELDGGGTYELTDGQKWLLHCRDNLIDRIGKLSAPPVIVFNGDACDLDDKRRTYQTISRNKATILGITIDALEPIVRMSSAVYFTRGTPAHNGKDDWAEELLADDFDAVKDKRHNAESWQRLHLDVDGVWIDIAHYASMSGLRYRTSSSAEALAGKIVHYYHDSGGHIPHLVIRSHNHHWGDSTDDHATRAIFTPSLCLVDEYAQRLGNDVSDVGALIIYCNGGKYEVEKVRYRLPGERQWIKI